MTGRFYDEDAYLQGFIGCGLIPRAAYSNGETAHLCEAPQRLGPYHLRFESDGDPPRMVGNAIFKALCPDAE